MIKIDVLQQNKTRLCTDEFLKIYVTWMKNYFRKGNNGQTEIQFENWLLSYNCNIVKDIHNVLEYLEFTEKDYLLFQIKELS